MSHLEEIYRKTQDTQEGLYFSVDLGTPWDSSGKAGPSGWDEGESLDFLAGAVAPATRLLN